jgi:hypothetical protein
MGEKKGKEVADDLGGFEIPHEEWEYIMECARTGRPIRCAPIFISPPIRLPREGGVMKFEKWEVRQKPVDAESNIFMGIYQGKMLVLPFVRNREEGELVCACVNAIRECAEPLDMSPLEFARRLAEYHHVGALVKHATDMVEDVERDVLDGEPLKSGPATGLLNEKGGDDEHGEATANPKDGA